MMRTAGAIKISHAVDLLETQVVKFLYEFLKRIEKSKKRTDARLFKDPRVRECVKLCEELSISDIEHPKLGKIVQVVKNLLGNKPDAKIIVFAGKHSGKIGLISRIDLDKQIVEMKDEDGVFNVLIKQFMVIG